MDTNETVKSIHRLATLRDAPSQGYRVSIVLTPHPPSGDVIPLDGEPADVGSWCAQTYMGRGKWGSIAAFGKDPEEALRDLLAGLVDAHKAVDERRAGVLKTVAPAP